MKSDNKKTYQWLQKSVDGVKDERQALIVEWGEQKALIVFGQFLILTIQ